MKAYTIGLMFCGLLSAAAGQAQTTQVTAGQWDRSATVKSGVLTYHWITPKPNQRSMYSQSMAGYDSHVAKIVMTPTQIAWVRQWERQYKVFSLPRHYPKPHRPWNYGAAFVNNLKIQDGSRSLVSTWNGMDQAKKANAASEAFFTWAEHQTTGH